MSELNIEVDLPIGLEKIVSKIKFLRESVIQCKTQISEMNREMTALEVLMERHIAKIAKQQAKKASKPPRKSGFASPMKVTDELCAFMALPSGTMISRTDTTKFINQYIKDHGLQNKEKKNMIIPDEALKTLLGPDATGVDITYFNLQTFINRHFQ